MQRCVIKYHHTKGEIKVELGAYFKSIVETDTAAVVICNCDHEIIYMNPAAVKNYVKYGGAALVGKNLLDCHAPKSREEIKRVVAWFGESAENNIVFTYYNEKKNRDVYMVALRNDSGELIGYYEKHMDRNRESAKPYAPVSEKP